MSGVEVLGVVAAAVQFADVGVRLAATLSSIGRTFRNCPKIIDERIKSVEQLVELSRVILTNKSLEQEYLRPVLQSGLRDATTLLELLQGLEVTGDGRHWGKLWRAVCTTKQESRIVAHFDKPESHKTALILSIGVANSHVLHSVDQSVIRLNGSTATAPQDAWKIESAIQSIGTQITGIATQVQQCQANTNAASTAVRTIESTLPSIDSRLDEVANLQKTIYELAASIQQSLAIANPKPSINQPPLTPPESPRSLSLDLCKPHWGAFLSDLDKSIDPSRRMSESEQRHFIVPVTQNALFTGRTDIIDHMRAQFSTEQGTQRRLILTGLGGVGKTQIATAFTYAAFASDEYFVAIWSFASDRERLLRSLTEAAKTLGLSPDLKHAADTDNSDLMPPLVTALIKWLSSEKSRKWLLVFDNVDDLDTFDITTFFPKVPWGDILITSRRGKAARLGERIPVNVMEPAEGTELLYKCARLPMPEQGPEASAKKLAAILGHLLLALDQAGAYISEQCIGFDAYLEIYEDGRDELLQHKPPAAVWNYEQTVFTTWELSYSKLKMANPLAAKLLDIAASFASDDIPLPLIFSLSLQTEKANVTFLKNFLEFDNLEAYYDSMLGPVPGTLRTIKWKFLVAIGQLLSFSLATQKSHSQSLSIHPLVHHWLRSREAQNTAEKADDTRAALTLTLRALINASDLGKYADAQLVYPDIFICLEYLNKFPAEFKGLSLARVGACVIAVDNWVPLSADQGTLLKADRFYELLQARERDQIDEWQIPPTLWTLQAAYRYTSKRQRSKAQKTCETYFATQDKAVTRFDRFYTACMAQICGPSYFRELKYDEAEAAYNRVQGSVDPTNFMLARKEIVLGAIQIDRGNADQAKMLLDSCCDGLRRGVGSNHFLWRVWHQLMALTLLLQGKADEAEALVLPHVKEGMEKLRSRRGAAYVFSDYELAEVYSRALRCQWKFIEATNFLTALLRLTEAAVTPPARALAELSALHVELEWLAADLKEMDDVDQLLRREVIDARLRIARKMYSMAEYAYEIEWTRGTWVFKHFLRHMDDFEANLPWETHDSGGKEVEMLDNSRSQSLSISQWL